MHPRTRATAIKHTEYYCEYYDKNVIAQHTRQAFESAVKFVEEFYNHRLDFPRTVILDSGCGQGMSTLLLARASPNVPVIGIDRSFDRLSRNVLESHTKRTLQGSGPSGNDAKIDQNHLIKTYESQPNLLFVRAEISDFWTMVAFNSSWVVLDHWLLYPNPYPKAKHLQRRWHGHPTFPLLLCLGGNLCLRSNWKIYCDEMEDSILAVTKLFLKQMDQDEAESRITRRILDVRIDNENQNHRQVRDQNNSSTPLTHFERKYSVAGLQLYELRFTMESYTPTERLELLAHLRVNLSKNVQKPFYL
jgi:tRNA G46 methylase TrmB